MSHRGDRAIDSETVKHGRRTYTINVYPDEGTPSPLETDEGVFITHRKSARSQYGNTPLDQDEHERIGQRIELFGNKAAKLDESLRITHEEDYEPLGEPLIGLPVYVYEHSGVAMSTRAFSCPWDSGQSGFIYVTEKTALEWMGGKRLSKEKVEKVLKQLAGIVKEYGMWCNGEVYYYTVEDENGDRIEDLGCGGFIGTEYLYEEAKSEVAAHHKWRVEEACKRRIATAIERIERLAWAARGVVTA